MTDPAAAPPTVTEDPGADGQDPRDRSTRDHYSEQPASWVAACCDRGVRHERNEDATAVAADPRPGTRAVLVVCDGVSSSRDSDVVSLAGARAARDLLATRLADDAGRPAEPEVLAPALTAALEAAAAAANEAVVAATDPGSDNAASCTFAAAVLDGDVAAHAGVGDSRVYWLPDPGTVEAPQQLGEDDSVAQFRISTGVPREQAEHSPHAHAITKWLGRDSSDVVPSTGALRLRSPGWLLVCSDGLWNYCSDPQDLQRLVATLGAPGPLALAEALVDWANAQGGRDNVSVALARHGDGETP